MAEKVEMTKDDVKALYQEFERQQQAQAETIAEVRELAKGILDPVELRERVSRKQGIVLAYGMMGQIKYSFSDLRRFLKAIDAYEKDSRFGGAESPNGITYRALFNASRPVDIERSKTVRNATLYKRDGNLLSFRVTGNSKPYYRVIIRMEAWNSYVGKTMAPLAAVRKILDGRISFECPCGRHQYWYRYMATVGNYAIEPLEHGFPKIRNPGLFGCCCKHVLKVLGELKSNRVLFVLSKELETERKKPGFSGGKKNVDADVLNAADLQLLQRKRLAGAAAKAFKQYEKEAAEIKKKAKPRQTFSPHVADAIHNVMIAAKAENRPLDPVLDGLALTFGIPRAAIEQLIKEQNL